jgi:hypothetical protein
MVLEKYSPRGTGKVKANNSPKKHPVIIIIIQINNTKFEVNILIISRRNKTQLAADTWLCNLI